MSKAITTDMFAQIKSAMSQQTNKNNKYRDILKLEVGNVYSLRLVPNTADPSKTFFHYYSHAWESFATGQYMSQVSPQTWGDKDPIAETRYSLSKHGTDEEKAKASKIIRRENWLANVYVVSDPTNSENEGQVKLLRFGKQIHKIIMDAIEGDDADEFGVKIFDLSPGGCNFKVKVERQGDYPTYVSSRFAGPSKIPGLEDESSINEVLESVHDLESVFSVKSYDELKEVLNEHFYCRESNTSEVDNAWEPEPKKTDATPKSEKLDDVDPLNDDKVKELLAGLGD